jgi:hypothetical protein
MNTIQIREIASLKLNVGEQSYTVRFPLRAVVEAEAATGKPLKTLNDWFALTTEDFPKVLAAGIGGPDAKEVAERVCDNLNAESMDEVHYALCKLAFPKLIAQLEEKRAANGSDTVKG